MYTQHTCKFSLLIYIYFIDKWVSKVKSQHLSASDGRRVPLSALGRGLSRDKVTSRMSVGVGVGECGPGKSVWLSGLHVSKPYFLLWSSEPLLGAVRPLLCG